MSLTALKLQKFPDKDLSWATSQPPSKVHSLPKPDAQRTKYWLFYSSSALGWKTKQLDRHISVFHRDSPSPPCPPGFCLLMYQQNGFLHVGGPSALQRDSVSELRWGDKQLYGPAEQDRTCLRRGNTCCVWATSALNRVGKAEIDTYIYIYTHSCVYKKIECLLRNPWNFCFVE